MAAKDSPGIGKIFGGVNQGQPPLSRHRSADQKGCKSRKGAEYPALKKIAQFLQQLSEVFVELAKTISSFNKILVSLIGVALLVAIFAVIIKAIWAGHPLPIESIIIPIVRVCISQIGKK
ncbi:MAG: hypothetical protein DMF06_01020 [Verrucomicrobia bacterium]|nr:MAG: hypothetical protein DMF06_01020 [Verrucomicrobiota bacterium]